MFCFLYRTYNLKFLLIYSFPFKLSISPLHCHHHGGHTGVKAWSTLFTASPMPETMPDIWWLINRCCWDFPGGTVVKNPPANAGDTGRPHMPQSNETHELQLLSLHFRALEPQLLSPRATTTEPCAPRARAPQQEKPPQWEARAPQQRVALLAATRENLCAATKTQCSQK